MLWNEYVTRVLAIGATGAAVLAATIESIETEGQRRAIRHAPSLWSGRSRLVGRLIRSRAQSPTA